MKAGPMLFPILFMAAGLSAQPSLNCREIGSHKIMNLADLPDGVRKGLRADITDKRSEFNIGDVGPGKRALFREALWVGCKIIVRYDFGGYNSGQATQTFIDGAHGWVAGRPKK